MKYYLILLVSFFELQVFSQNWVSPGFGIDNTIREIFTDTVDNVMYLGGDFSAIVGDTYTNSIYSGW